MKALVLKSVLDKAFLLLLFVFLSGGQHLFSKGNDPRSAELVNVMDSLLQNNILKQWYPRSIDSVEGGYFTEFKYDWKKPKD
jgi:hypothetical protein